MQFPKHDQSLYMDETTTKAEIIDYLESRLAEPTVIGDAVIYNFNTHALDASALVQTDEIDDGVYIVPYQISGVWGFMASVLPQFVANSPVLEYKLEEQEYVIFENYRGTESDLIEVRSRLQGVTGGADE